MAAKKSKSKSGSKSMFKEGCGRDNSSGGKKEDPAPAMNVAKSGSAGGYSSV